MTALAVVVVLVSLFGCYLLGADNHARHTSVASSIAEATRDAFVLQAAEDAMDDEPVGGLR